MASSPITSWQRDGETMETVTDFIILGSKITADGDRSHKIKRHLLLGREAMTNLDSILKKQRHHFADKGPSGQSDSLFSSHVWIWELDHKEGWALKNSCFQTVVLEKSFESPLDCKEMKPVNPKGNQPWIFTGRTDTEAEVLILWPSDEELKDLKRPWCQERLRAGGEGGFVGWDGWMAPSTQWIWVWAN